MLTKEEILWQVRNGCIQIKPFISKHLGPNSYDVRLARTLYKIHRDQTLDIRKPYTYKTVLIRKEGTILDPNYFYLGATVEYTSTPYHVPILEGRSSVARYGITVHQTAGFGDLGFSGHWTLEIRSACPTIIYPNMRIAQVRFEPVDWKNIDVATLQSNQYQGKYKNEFSRNPKPRVAKPGNFF